MKAEDTEMDDYARCAELEDLSARALSGEDIRWNEVSHVIANAQAEISFKAGMKKVATYIRINWCCPYPVGSSGDKEWQQKLKEWIGD